MATEFDFNQKDDEKNPQAGTSGPTQIGASGQSAMGNAQAPQKGTSSGRFTNIQNFIKANQGSNLGGNISGRIGGLSNQVNEQTNKEKQSFQEQTAKAFNPFQGGREFVQGALQDPTKAAGSEQDLSRFQKITSGQYAGPKQLQNADQLKQSAQNVQQIAGLTGSDAGRQTLLQNFFSKPSYNQGQRTFDNLLLQADPRELRKLQQSRAGATMANRNLAKTEQQAFAEGQGKTQEAAALGQEATGALGTETGKRDTELNQKLEQISADEIKRKEDFNRVQQQLASGEINEDDAVRLGLLQPGTNDLSKFELNTYGADPLKALQTNIYGGPFDRSSVASQDEANRLNALSKLAGRQGEFDPNAVNKYVASTQGFDQGILDRETQRGKAEMQRLESEAASQAQPFQQAAVFDQLRERALRGDSSITDQDIQNAFQARQQAFGAMGFGNLGFYNSGTPGGDIETIGGAGKLSDVIRQAAASGGQLTGAQRQALNAYTGRADANADLTNPLWDQLNAQREANMAAAQRLAGSKLRIKPKK